MFISKPAFLKKLAAFLCSLFIYAFFGQYFSYRYLEINFVFLIFSLFGRGFLLLLCVYFFRIANTEKFRGEDIFAIGLLLNCLVAYTVLFVWKFGGSGYYTSCGPLSEIIFEHNLFETAIFFFPVSVFMIMFGAERRK
ncbi:MAG: hypothetical protein BWY26_00501 [Elusimicrobia bacterium ADurb.Bin231]|nr:MAG: hypothetical protein BWY26_00501 [Elusimicrobia bacterium ADurb.Bin231]